MSRFIVIEDFREMYRGQLWEGSPASFHALCAAGITKPIPDAAKVTLPTIEIDPLPVVMIENQP